jgi:glycosyltransferase involved in cell wall biosynthesis
MKKSRILIAGHEIGGQMQLLVETFRKKGVEATSVAFNSDFRNYDNDIRIEEKNWFSRFLFFVWAVRHYHVFHFFWGRSLLSIKRFHLIDLPILRFFNKKIYPHFRGLDIVDIKYFDYLRDNTNGKATDKPDMSRKDQLKSLKKWYRYSTEILVSEPDLFYVAKNSILSPQVIDLSYWNRNSPPVSEKDGVIRVVHAPTSRRKKGTEYIEKAIGNLQKKGYKIKLILAENLQAYAVKDFYAKADIGIDQLLYGWHGKVSCELMAMEIPVICYINPKFGKYRRDLPIVNATPKTLEEKLEELIVNKELREEIGKKSLEYVRKYHNVEVEVDNLIKLYGIEITKEKSKKKMKNVKTW